MQQRSFGGRRRVPSHFRRNRKFSPVEKKFDIHKIIRQSLEKAKPNQSSASSSQANPAPQTPDNTTPTSTKTFQDFNLDNRIKRNVTAKGYKTPTPIQEQTIPLALTGKDIVGTANTGTGKTAAFLLPMLNKVLISRGQKVLILAPTRELALQIEQEFRAFSRDLEIRSVLCIGGTSMGIQIRELKRKYNFIIGTPGRIKDLNNRRLIHLDLFQNVILDEVDRMLDMGFLPDIKFLLEELPEKRHSLFFSATIPKQIEDLIRTFLKDPTKISVQTRETAENIQQEIVRVHRDQKKIQVMQNLLKKEEFKKVLVFGRTKRGVDILQKSLTESGFRVDSIHGDKTQSRRQRALRDFKENRVKILVATDVAARGLDIDNVSHVINFDMPETHEDYIHRIGRTGRGTKKGIALTLVTD